MAGEQTIQATTTLNPLLNAAMAALASNDFSKAIPHFIAMGHYLHSHGFRTRSQMLGRDDKEAEGYVRRKSSTQLFKSEFRTEMARSEGEKKAIIFNAGDRELNEAQARAFWALMAAWEEGNIGRGVMRREGDTRNLFKPFKNKAEWKRQDRRDFRLGVECLRAYVGINEEYRLDPTKQEDQEKAYELDEKASAAIKGYRNTYQTVFKWLGILFAAGFAGGCGFQTFAAMFNFAGLGIGIMPVVLGIALVQLAATTVANWIICRKHVPNLFRMFSEWRVHKYKEDQGGDFKAYSSGGFKLAVAFFLSLTVGTLFAALTWEAVYNIPSQVSFLAGAGFIISPLAIVSGLIILVSMTLLILGEMVEFFQLDWTKLPSELWGQLKDHFNGLAKTQDFPHLTQEQANSQRNAAIIGTIVVTALIAIGLGATMYACTVALTQVLPMIGLLSNLSASAIFDISLTLGILSFFGQMAFVFKTGGKMVANGVAGYFKEKVRREGVKKGEKGYAPVKSGLIARMRAKNESRLQSFFTWVAKGINAVGNALIPFKDTLAMVAAFLKGFLVPMSAGVVTAGAFTMSISAPAAGESLNAEELPNNAILGRMMSQFGFVHVPKGYDTDQRVERSTDGQEWRLLAKGEAKIGTGDLVTRGAIREKSDWLASFEPRLRSEVLGETRDGEMQTVAAAEKLTDDQRLEGDMMSVAAIGAAVGAA